MPLPALSVWTRKYYDNTNFQVIIISPAFQSMDKVAEQSVIYKQYKETNHLDINIKEKPM